MTALNAPPARPSTVSPAAALLQRELDAARSQGPLKTLVIPPCPELLSRMQAELAKPEPDLTEVAHIAASDVAMAASLLKAANSPAFSTGQAVNTVGQAMNRMGLDRTAEEMRIYLTRRAIAVNSPLLRRFWERSAQRAHAMGFLARQLPGMSPDLAHTYGLFCHVGIPVMMQSLRGYSGTMAEANARIDQSVIATENANHRTDHAVVGALVARVWRLAPEVMVAVRRHHDLDMLGEHGTDPEIHTLVAAGLVAEHLMRRREGLPPDADWARHHVQALAWLDVPASELEHWEEALTPLLEAV